MPVPSHRYVPTHFRMTSNEYQPWAAWANSTGLPTAPPFLRGEAAGVYLLLTVAATDGTSSAASGLSLRLSAPDRTGGACVHSPQ